MNIKGDQEILRRKGNKKTIKTKRTYIVSMKPALKRKNLSDL